MKEIFINIHITRDGTVNIGVGVPKDTGCPDKCCEESDDYETNDCKANEEDDDYEGFLYDNLD